MKQAKNWIKLQMTVTKTQADCRWWGGALSLGGFSSLPSNQYTALYKWQLVHFYQRRHSYFAFSEFQFALYLFHCDWFSILQLYFRNTTSFFSSI